MYSVGIRGGLEYFLLLIITSEALNSSSFPAVRDSDPWLSIRESLSMTPVSLEPSVSRIDSDLIR